jgi:hypothetical protein
MQAVLGKVVTSRVWNGFAGIGTNRFYGATTKTAPGNKQPEKSVFISQSTDVHTNLALEDWIYRNFNFENHRVLLLWRNDPCVVIGRHQNPWSEVDVSLAEEVKLPVVRRNSGGGCVYHDQGNLNCTFFTPRDGYDRKSNLEIICRALKRQFDIKADVSPRLDVNVDGYKVKINFFILQNFLLQSLTFLRHLVGQSNNNVDSFFWILNKIDHTKHE